MTRPPVTTTAPVAVMPAPVAPAASEMAIDPPPGLRVRDVGNDGIYIDESPDRRIVVWIKEQV